MFYVRNRPESGTRTHTQREPALRYTSPAGRQRVSVRILLVEDEGAVQSYIVAIRPRKNRKRFADFVCKRSGDSLDYFTDGFETLLCNFAQIV